MIVANFSIVIVMRSTHDSNVDVCCYDAYNRKDNSVKSR